MYTTAGYKKSQGPEQDRTHLAWWSQSIRNVRVCKLGSSGNFLKKRSLQVHPMVETHVNIFPIEMAYWEARAANGCTHEVSPKIKGMSNHQQSNHGLRSNMARNKSTFGDDLRIKLIINCRICLWEGNHFFHCLPLPVQKLWVLLCEALPAGILLIISHNNPIIIAL